MTTGAPDFLTPAEVAERLRLGLSTVYDLMTRGELPYYQHGRAKRVRAGDVDEYLERCKRVGGGVGSGKAVGKLRHLRLG